MANVTITQLPTAGALTGTEAVPVVQNGVTVQTTTGAIQATSNLSTYPFLMTQATGALGASRYITTGAGMTTVDGGAGSTFAINLVGAPLALVTSGTGFQVKTGSTTLINRSIAVSGSGLSISNGSGISGDPTISLSGIVANFASVSGIGLLTVNGTVVSQTTITGTSNSITITNGNASGGAPTIAIADNPVLTGTGGITVPTGTTAQRAGTNGTLRYNTSTATFEGYANGSWGAIISGSGVATFSAGSTGFTPSSPTAGGIVLAGTLNVASGGTGANTLTGYVYGNGTSPMTASTTIPTTSLSGTISNAQLANSTITIGSTAVSLGGTITSLAGVTIDGSTNTLSNIANASLTNSSVTIGTTAISLGATSLTLGGLTTVTVTQDPVSALQLATKQYVDNIAQGLDPKGSVVNASTANFTASYSNGTLGVGATLTNTGTLVAFSADGITNSVGDRVLIKNQTTSAQNGIYTVTVVGSASVAWVLTRATDMDIWAEVPSSFVFVETGTLYADTGWVCTSNQGGTMGTTAITWVQFSGSGSGVSSITFGSTGLTPSTTTTGAVTVAGTLATTNGGTNLTSFTSGGAVYATSTSVLTTGTLPNTAGGTGQSSAFTQYGVTYASSTTALATTSAGTSTTVLHGNASGAPTFGAVSLTADVSGILPVLNGGTGITSLGTGVATALGVNVGSAGAFVVNGGALGTPSSGTVTNLTGTASININGTVGATTASSGAFTTISATGVITSTLATGTAPFTVASTTQVANLNAATAGTATNATNATNLALTAGSGATNYITFASSATGNQAINTSTGLTFNATNSTITSGISGGTF